MNNSNELKLIPSNIILKGSYNQFYYHMQNPLNNPKWMDLIISQIFDYLRSTDPSQRKFLELEIKLGSFEFFGQCVLYSYLEDINLLPILDHNQSSYYQFNSGVSEDQFYALWNIMEEESKANDLIRFVDPPVNYEETLYDSKKRKSTRFTKLGKSDKKEEVILKTDKKHFNLRNCGKDMRVTICKELPTDITCDDKTINQRNKFRFSYTFGFFRIDFTIAYISDGINSDPVTYEIEFELCEINKLIEITENLKNYEQFDRVMRRYLENILSFYHAIKFIPRQSNSK